MSSEEMANALKQFICDTFDIEYQKGLKISVDNNVYICEIELNNVNRPIVIQGEFNSDGEFLTYMQTELKKRRLHYTEYANLIKQLDHINEQQ